MYSTHYVLGTVLSGSPGYDVEGCPSLPSSYLLSLLLGHHGVSGSALPWSSPRAVAALELATGTADMTQSRRLLFKFSGVGY